MRDHFASEQVPLLMQQHPNAALHEGRDEHGLRRGDRDYLLLEARHPSSTIPSRSRRSRALSTGQNRIIERHCEGARNESETTIENNAISTSTSPMVLRYISQEVTRDLVH